ncbi:hypothetical protein SLE2022_189100 [Rubroshorea leprosula]
MAIELCSENSGMSPRISFSHDLCLSDIVPVEQRPPRSKSSSLSSSVDFDFCVRKSFDQESSSADELFSDGKILPTEIKKKNIVSAKQLSEPTQASQDDEGEINNNNLKKESSKANKISRDEVEEKQSSKSFWRFKRSSSLNCNSGYGHGLCPLPLLSRSYSTGSAPKQSSQKHPVSQKPSSSMYHQKPPLKKSYGPYAYA